MEIDKAIKESEDRRLKTKYNNAIYVIRRAFALYSVDEVAFSFNGGKDSTVLLHLLRAGYYLHKAENNLSTMDSAGTDIEFPIRTIYFESPSAFTEINSFTYEAASQYKLQMDIIRLDFKSGLEALLKANPIRAIFLGVRIGDPTAVGQEQFSPSSPGWPPFMRVNPILDWSYRDIWAFLLICKVQYCSLYDQGYTSIGSIHDTVPNALLCQSKSNSNEEKYKPAYLLQDGRLERAGRVKRFTSQPLSAVTNGLDSHLKSIFTASIIAVGDEILFGTVEDRMESSLCGKLHSIGWAVSHIAVARNDIDSVADEVERLKSTNDMVFIYGGVGPLLSDVTVAGVAKAFGIRMALDEEFEEYLRHLIGDRNEMAQLPEGITELLHHEKLSVPLVYRKARLMKVNPGKLHLSCRKLAIFLLQENENDHLSKLFSFHAKLLQLQKYAHLKRNRHQLDQTTIVLQILSKRYSKLRVPGKMKIYWFMKLHRFFVLKYNGKSIPFPYSGIIRKQPHFA